METIADVEGDPRSRALLVLLPPAFGSARDFIDQGFVAAIRRRGLAVDVIAAGATADHYLDRTVVARLHHDVIVPARARGYRALWLGGISIGGFGSLLYLQAHAAAVDGLLLLAPYLGSRPVVNEVLRAGGFARWQPQAGLEGDHEQRLLAWLKQALAAPAQAPPIHVGYGAQDRFAPTIDVLADALPPHRVARHPGGHDWATWTPLWHTLLDRQPFRVTSPASP
jgi:hypothetical protein